MSTYGREYAPNLFNSYQDWYDNYLMKCGAEPSKEERDDANAYFLNKTNKKDTYNCIDCKHFENVSLYNCPCDDCGGKRFEPKENKMTDEQKRIACATFFDKLFKYLNELSESNGKARVDYTSGEGPVRNWYGCGDKWVIVESCNKDFSRYLVTEGNEECITYYGKPTFSFRISDHWNWFSNLNKCEDPFYIQCNSLDMPYPRYRPDSKPTKPRYGLQVCFTRDGETYRCIYGDRFDRKTKTWEWIEDDPKKVAIKVLTELEAREYEY